MSVANKRMVLTLPAHSSFGIIARIKVGWWYRPCPAAQGAGGPHMRGVSHLPRHENCVAVAVPAKRCR